ncbi:hypothetical protein BT96DRAFT_950196 [Gymnopus androsaceus JB14]|uniref:Uncharacterized protein n=1 Tax=Gymnopus androsaceus JB14 TaxID=1447944 RepID=A0A6A4GHL0_9AGAR|nr:hypothetical protein BT96DRAFT_950196 [Gymnopus androsaceus JB14]
MHWKTRERSRQQAESVALCPTNYKDLVQAIANRWLQEKAAAVRRRSPSPVPVGLPQEGCLHLQLSNLEDEEPLPTVDTELIAPQVISPSSPPSANPATPPLPASATFLPSRTSASPSAQSGIISLPPAVEAYLASQTQLHLPPAPDDRVTKGWGILHQFFINKLNPSDAFEALKLLNCNDALDAEWALVWKRIKSIGIEEGINDEQEIQALQTLLDTHDPVYNSAISCDDELHCLLEWRDPVAVRPDLEELSIGQKWFGMLDRILSIHDKHLEEYAQIQIELAKMKPIRTESNNYEGQEDDHEVSLSHDKDEVRNILDIVDDYTDAQLDWEQKDLLSYFNLTLRQSELWDKYGVYHVCCLVGQEASIIRRITEDVAAGVAPESLLYIRATSLSSRNYPFTTYLALINGLIYREKQQYSFYRDTTKDGLRVEEKLLAKKKHPVPVLLQRSNIPMPVNKHIVAWNRNAIYKRPVYIPGNTTRVVLEVPVYGYEENREVKIIAGPQGENILKYVVKAKGPGGKLPSQILDEWNIAYNICSYGFTMPHTCNKLLMIARGPEEHVGHLGCCLYVNMENQIVLQFYAEEIVCDKEPVAQLNLYRMKHTECIWPSME